MDITAILIVKNEEKNIERALKSVSFCSETIVVDEGSTDRTVEEASKHRVRVAKGEGGGDFSRMRSSAMEQAKTPWVLFIDADEQVSPELRRQLECLDEDSQKQAYYIKRRDFFWGRELRYGEISKARNRGIIRLMKKGSGRWAGAVHEEFALQGSNTAGSLEGFLNHYPHPTVREFIEDINRYSDLRARELKEKGVRPDFGVLLFYPPAKFILSYFLYLGFLDGPAGFAYSFLMSFHSFLVRSKLYQYAKIDKDKQ